MGCGSKWEFPSDIRLVEPLYSTPFLMTETGLSAETTTIIVCGFLAVNLKAELYLAPRARSSVAMAGPSRRQAKRWR